MASLPTIKFMLNTRGVNWCLPSSNELRSFDLHPLLFWKVIYDVTYLSRLGRSCHKYWHQTMWSEHNNRIHNMSHLPFPFSSITNIPTWRCLTPRHSTSPTSIFYHFFGFKDRSEVKMTEMYIFTQYCIMCL